MPVLALIPAGLALFGGGWFVGSSSSGWIKWAFVAIALIVAYSFAKKLGVVK